MGKNFPIAYKYDNSRPMGDTIQNSLSNKLDKDKLLHLVSFDNLEGSLDDLWNKIVSTL